MTLRKTLAAPPALPPPIWLMRQAGRYLPEYKAVRATTGNFLEFCYSPDKAMAVTLQPIDRFDLDAAIIFSDILVIPDALGQKVAFVEGEGPSLDRLPAAHLAARLKPTLDLGHLAPVYQAIRQTRAKLAPEKSLIGFAGAPWTLACYMIDGNSQHGFAEASRRAATADADLAALIDRLRQAVIAHAVAQIDAGADTIQLFESWGGALPTMAAVENLSLAPLRAIAAAIKVQRPGTTVIVFPRGVGWRIADYAATLGADAVSIDQGVDVAWAARYVQAHAGVQGNLDPALLVQGGTALRAGAEKILRALSPGKFIFNLGHGVLPTTPPAHVGELVKIVRAWRP